MPIILAIAVLIFSLFALGDYHEAAVVTGGQIVVGVLFVPAVILAGVLVLYGSGRALCRDRIAYHVLVALLALPLPLLAGIRLATAHRKKHLQDAVTDWCVKADSLAAVLLDYYHQHPERFHSRVDSEEVSVYGFLAFCESHPDFSRLRLSHDSEQLLDYARQPFRYYVDRDHDGRMGPSFRGVVSPPETVPERVGIMDSRTQYLGIAPKPIK